MKPVTLVGLNRIMRTLLDLAESDLPVQGRLKIIETALHVNNMRKALREHGKRRT